MDLGSGLYVTVVGMGLVFVSLALLMLAMKLLDRVFPYKGDESPEGQTTAAPQAAIPAAPQPAAQTVTQTAASSPSGPFDAVVGGQKHRVELKEAGAKPMLVVVDGQEHRVEEREGDSAQLVVDGHAYSVQVAESAPDHVTVSVGDEVFRIELPAHAVEAATTPQPAVAAPVPAVVHGVGEAVSAPLPGRILRVSVASGDRVTRGQEVCILEAMKMENSIRAPEDGTVLEVRVQVGQSVKPGEALVLLAAQPQWVAGS